MTRYTVDAKAIAEVSAAASKEEVRYNIQCVHIEDIKGVRHYVATNGYVLFMVKEEHPLGYQLPDGGVNIKILSKPTKSQLKLRQKCYMEVDEYEKYASIYCEDYCFVTKVVDCKYPEFMKVVPNVKKTKKAHEYCYFNPTYLTMVKTFFEEQPLMVPYMDSKTQPALFISGDKYAVLMPMRI